MLPEQMVAAGGQDKQADEVRVVQGGVVNGTKTVVC